MGEEIAVIEEGRVLKNIKDLSRILIEVPATCDKCEHCVLGPGSTKNILAVNKVNAKKGDKVKVFVNDNILFASFLFYFVPLIALIFFTVLALSLKFSELYSGLMGCGGMVITYLLIKILAKYIKVKNYIIEKI